MCEKAGKREGMKERKARKVEEAVMRIKGQGRICKKDE